MYNSSNNFSDGKQKPEPSYSLDDWIAYDFEWEYEKSQKSEICKIDGIASGASKAPANGQQDYSKIVTFGFEDSYGNKNSFDITDYSSSKEFLETIKEKLLQYKYCFAWGSKAVKRKNDKTGELDGINGDLVVLDSNLKANKIPTIVGYNEFSGIPYIKKDHIIGTGNSRIFLADIDLLKVYTKPLVRLIFKNKYKSLHLYEVCKALLGIGKLNDKTGAKLEEMSIEERKLYCMHDAHLVAELVKIKNGDIIKIMQIIAFHTRLKFEEVCHKGMSGIWKKILDNEIRKKINLIGYRNVHHTLRLLYSNKSKTFIENNEYYEDEEEEEDSEGEENELVEYKENSYDLYMEMLEIKSKERKLNSASTSDDWFYNRQWSLNNDGKNIIKIQIDKDKFKGGLVLIPIRGLYYDVYLMDAVSMYPTIIIKNKLSPETVNCKCCKDNPKSKGLMDEHISKDLVYLQEKGETHYWICQRREGLFSKILKDLTEKRIQYKKEGKELESLAMKIIINSGYGVFGSPKFKYYDPSVAEIVTALGRQTLLKIKEIAEEMNFTVIYGDSDSLFVNNIKNDGYISKFIDHCKIRLNVTVNHEKTFRKLILVGKKHYIGIPYGDDEPVIKGMEGIKSDRPEFIQTTFKEMVKDIQNDINPILKLRKALEELDRRQVPKERLVISLTLTKNPQEYINDCLQKRLGTKLRLKKGDTLPYYKSDKQVIVYDKLGKQHTKTIGESDNPDDISYAKYKEMLVNSVEDVTEILGYGGEKDWRSKRKLGDSSN